MLNSELNLLDYLSYGIKTQLEAELTNGRLVIFVIGFDPGLFQLVHISFGLLLLFQLFLGFLFQLLISSFCGCDSCSVDHGGDGRGLSRVVEDAGLTHLWRGQVWSQTKFPHFTFFTKDVTLIQANQHNVSSFIMFSSGRHGNPLLKGETITS